MQEIRIPDVGDASEIEVIEICVKQGDMVAVDAPLIVLESDKASLEVPSPESGTIVAIKVALGDKVAEGDLIMVIDAGDSEGDSGTETGAGKATQAEVCATYATDVSAGATEQQPALEGLVETAMQSPDMLVAAPDDKEKKAKSDLENAGIIPPVIKESEIIYAGPAVRRLARELGVDLTLLVPGSGFKNRIVKADVNAWVSNALAARQMAGNSDIIDQDFSRFGNVEILPESRIRQRVATNLAACWRSAVHVTHHDEVNITDLDAFYRKHNSRVKSRDEQLTLLAFVTRACTLMLEKYPRFNGSLTANGQSFVYKSYINIGIAVDTEKGLLVPVIRDANKKTIKQLTQEIAQLASKTRERKLKPAEMQGASFTISSLGKFGGTGFTPIINVPEVAILGVSRTVQKPILQDDSVVSGLFLPLSLSYDHRAINGLDAGRFVNGLTAVLADIMLLLL